MNTYHRFSLSKRGKHLCPQCEHKTFVLYIDHATGQPLNEKCGKCDRANNCGYHYPPKQYFTDNKIPFAEREYKIIIPKPQPKPNYIDLDFLQKSMKGYENNSLVQFLVGRFGAEETHKAVERYFIGTSNWNNATVFWQIDRNNRIRTGKIMQYNAQTGKRIKEPISKITWVHSRLRINDFNLAQCLFGEHLLQDTTKIVAIVESEKTAIIASICLPEYIWLACGGLEQLSMEKCKCLYNRTVVLFPDLKGLEKWARKAFELQLICRNVYVSDYLERYATDEEREQGLDIADFLLKA